MPSLARFMRLVNFSAMELAFLATQAAATVLTGCVLPKNARPVLWQSLGGATGGASPTVDIGGKQNAGVSGLSGADDTDYFVNEGDADTAGAAIALTGVGANIVTTAPIQICGGVGASAAGGGTHRSVLYFLLGGSPPRGT